MAAYRCPQCKEFVEPVIDGSDLVSYCCDEVVERVWMCEACGEREQHPGCDECFACVLDQSIADPRTIEQCTPELQAQIAQGLAERLQLCGYHAARAARAALAKAGVE